MITLNSQQKLIFYSLAIFVTYFYYGILQEKITRSKYGDRKEVFTYFISLVLTQCIINAVFAKIMLSTFFQQGPDQTPFYYYASLSLSYLTAMVSSNSSLKYVNYPTQVIGKSCKPIPVLVFASIFGKKVYQLSKYLSVLIIVFGVAIFIYKEEPKTLYTLYTQRASPSFYFSFGEILLILSLIMDGITASIQEKMKSKFQTKSLYLMYKLNVWSVLYLGLLAILLDEITYFVNFISKYPFILYNILIFSISSAIGQIFIFFVVIEFGPLPCSIITTVRKFFTVLASVVFFKNIISNRQWIGTFLVFTGLGLDSYFSKSN